MPDAPCAALCPVWLALVGAVLSDKIQFNLVSVIYI